MNATGKFDIPMPHYGRSDCSPKLARDFTGFRISAPELIVLSEKREIAICGAYQLSNTVNNLFGANLIEETIIVFTNKASGISFSFNLIPPGKHYLVEAEKKDIPEDRPELSPENILKSESTIIGRYFNIDAFMFKSDFPIEEATYTVHAKNYNLKSNSLKIIIKI